MSRSIEKPESNGFAQKAEELWLRAVRLYTFNTPIKKGKYRLFQLALKACRHPHRSLRVDLKDGRKLWVNLTTGMQETVFFHGEFEIPITSIARQIVKAGDTCIDAGANYGWYTTLFANVVGKAGSVHSFEPVPQTFAELKRNYELLGSPANVHINNLAVGDAPGTIVMNLFKDQPTGHASMAAKEGVETESVSCELITLDSYLEKHTVNQVDFVKVDIEGAELMFLRGASRLFDQQVPPVILMEMALAQSKYFGYTPNDLLTYLSEKGDYDFYAVDEVGGKLVPITTFEPEDIGANVFCIPRNADERIMSIVSKYTN